MRLLLADHHRLVLAGIQSALAGAHDIEVVGSASSGEAVLPLVHELRPDVALLDVHLPGMDGITCLGRIKARYPETKVMLMSGFEVQGQAAAAIAGGASGYVIKAIEPEALAGALRTVAGGHLFTLVAEQHDGHAAGREAGLTKREVAILRELAEGRSNREIATTLSVTEQTVKFHLTNTYRKLRVNNRTEAARAAFRLGICSDHLLRVTPPNRPS